MPEENEEKNPEKRLISNTTAFIMISVAVFFDFIVFFINFIPFLGLIIGIAISVTAFMIFFLWFKLKGVTLMTPRRVAAMGIGFIISIIPFANLLPEITLSVVIVISSTMVKL